MTSRAPADLVQPRFLSVPDEFDERRTLGPEVAAIATLAGFPPDPEQQFLLDVSFALDKAGRFLIFETVLIAPRQNLKTGFAKQRALGKLFVCRRPLVVWSAHEFDTARRALLDVEAMIDGAPSLRRAVQLTSRDKVATHGAVPEITLRPERAGMPAPTLAFKTRTSGGARGLSGDDLFIDEAFAAQSDQMGAVLPIMLARPNSQVDFLSSACRPESAYLWDLVQAGRKGGGRRMLYAEWCAPPPDDVCDKGAKCQHRRDEPGCGCDKPEVIILAHSAVTRGRIEMQKVVDLRRTMPEDEYPREIMGWHDEPVADLAGIPSAAWLDRAGAVGRPDGPVAFALSAAWPDADAGSIAVVGRHNGEVYAQLVEHRKGTAWMPARILELRDAWNPAVIILDDKDPAAIEKANIEKLGVELTPINSTERGQAFGMIVAAVMGDAPYLRHYDQDVLNDAVRSAQKRPVGDAHTWAVKGPDDISPIVAVTDALFGLSTHAAPVFFGSWR